jgi:hypothetical protein
VEVVGLDIDLGHFGVGDLDGLRVVVVVETAMDGEPGLAMIRVKPLPWATYGDFSTGLAFLRDRIASMKASVVRSHLIYRTLLVI